MQKLEKRLDDLEIKFSYQQEVVDSLNDTITKQWDEIDRLKKLTKRLREEVVNLKESSPTSSGVEAPPPHY